MIMGHQPPYKFKIGQRVLVVYAGNAKDGHHLVGEQGTIMGDERKYKTLVRRGYTIGYLVDVPNAALINPFGPGFFVLPGSWLIPLDDPDQAQTTTENAELDRKA